MTVADPEEGPGGPPPLIFRRNWGPKGGKTIFLRPPPPPPVISRSGSGTEWLHILGGLQWFMISLEMVGCISTSCELSDWQNCFSFSKVYEKHWKNKLSRCSSSIDDYNTWYTTQSNRWFSRGPARWEMLFASWRDSLEHYSPEGKCCGIVRVFTTYLILEWMQ